MEDTMKKSKNQMILYRGLKYQKLFDEVCMLLTEGEREDAPDAFACANRLIELAVTYGFEGNLWHCFLAFCLANHENAYSTSCEIVGPVKGTLNELARHDFRILRELFSCSIGALDGAETGIWHLMESYENPSEDSRVFNRRIRDRIVELAAALEQTQDEAQFQACVTEFYREFGVGKFGLNKAFHIQMDEANGKAEILPITRVEHIYLNDLVGYELQKEKLIENTEAFIEGRAAKKVLRDGQILQHQGNPESVL